MVDFIVVGLSAVIFFFYLISIFAILEIRKRLNNEAKTSMTLFILALLVLVLRRLQQIFLEAEFVTAIPYLTDIVTLIFSILFFSAVFTLYRAMKKVGGSGGNAGESFKSYKKSLGRKIIR